MIPRESFKTRKSDVMLGYLWRIYQELENGQIDEEEFYDIIEQADSQ